MIYILGIWTTKKSILLRLQIHIISFINTERRQQITLHSLWLDENRKIKVWIWVQMRFVKAFEALMCSERKGNINHHLKSS